MYFLHSFILLLCLLAGPSAAATFSLSLDSIRHDAFEADGVKLSLDAARKGEADIRIARLLVAGVEYKQLRMHCSGFYFDGHRLDCPTGTLHREDERGRDRPPLPFSLSYRAGDEFFEFALRDADVLVLSPLVKRLRGWHPAGRVDFRILTHQGKASLNLSFRDVSFATKEGDVVGKNISMNLDVEATRQRDGWNWHALLDWPQGELFRAPWRRSAGVRLTADGLFGAKEIVIQQARAEANGIGAVNAALRWDRERGEATTWGFVTDRLDLNTAMNEWVQPWLVSIGLPVWKTSGHALFSAEGQAGHLQRFYAGLEDATVADSTGYIELRGVNAHIPWQDGVSGDADFSITAGRLGDLPVGRFDFPMRIEENGLVVKNLVAPMIDGRFGIDKLRINRGPDGWHGDFSGGIEGVSMPKLSRAVKIPTMDGKLTARIPRVSYENGVLALDGALSIEVFDGGLIVHQLRVIDPFSAKRRFVADVTARRLDLGMLTETFSFGSIEGRFDADLHNLEMLSWKPLRFDVRIADSPGDDPRILSLGALQDITALGESQGKGSEGEAIRKIPERAIGGFSYAHINIGGKLRDGIFELEGLARERDGVILMQGSGIPSVSIIGYNPRIDWEALVARIREVIAGKPGVLIE